MPDPTTPTPSPTMSSQRRATPAQWAALHLVDPFNDAASCILELRDRVEALEAAALGRHGESADSAAALSLVDQVASAIFSTPGDFKDEARAAIREVVAWLRSEYPRREGYGTAWANLIEEEANRCQQTSQAPRQGAPDRGQAAIQLSGAVHGSDVQG